MTENSIANKSNLHLLLPSYAPIISRELFYRPPHFFRRRLNTERARLDTISLGTASNSVRLKLLQIETVKKEISPKKRIRLDTDRIHLDTICFTTV